MPLHVVEFLALNARFRADQRVAEADAFAVARADMIDRGQRPADHDGE